MIRRLPLYVAGAFLILTTISFLFAWGVTDNFNRTWDVLLGNENPFSRGWPWLLFAVSFLGYLLVPVFIAVAATEAIARYRRVSSKSTEAISDETLEELDGAVQALRAKKIKPS